MITELQNLTIAKACGWTYLPKDPEMMQYVARMPNGKWDKIPDYINDLNAMHEAEKILFPKFEIEWHNQLQNVCGCSWRVMLHSTAAQRAEAFLRTLNLWKD